ncbi:MAG TPA: hypothetical protein VFO16_19170 [Pseudonocardiaceae bacterium]|nr:hypothetical protein [Pseudonocardiaceae bacterium]
MRTLVPHLDLRPALLRVAASGMSFVENALDHDYCRRLQHEVQDGPFERLPGEVGPYHVREDADMFRITEANLGGYPAVRQARRELTTRIHADGEGIGGIDRWFPNDIAVMRYKPGSIGVSPHRDGLRNHYLIAIITSHGSAPLAHCANREGTIIEEWETIPGSLALLRAPGLADAEKHDRPFHAVRGPAAGWRYSLTLRMNTSLPGPAAAP